MNKLAVVMVIAALELSPSAPIKAKEAATFRGEISDSQWSPFTFIHMAQLCLSGEDSIKARAVRRSLWRFNWWHGHHPSSEVADPVPHILHTAAGRRVVAWYAFAPIGRAGNRGSSVQPALAQSPSLPSGGL